MITRLPHRLNNGSKAVSVFLLTFCFLTLGTQAQNIDWSGNTGAQAWNTTSNWVGGVAPGSANTAVFSTTAGTGTTIAIDAGRQITGMTFTNTASNNYIIGGAGANAGPALSLTNGGTIVVNSGSTAKLTINAPLIIQPADATSNGSFTITNNATRQWMIQMPTRSSSMVIFPVALRPAPLP